MKGALPLWLASGLYLWQALNYWSTNERGMAIAFVGYAFANMGFILAVHGI